MPSVVDDNQDVHIDVDEIDFSDIDARYKVDMPLNYDTVVVVDNAPIVGESKVERFVAAFECWDLSSPSCFHCHHRATVLLLPTGVTLTTSVFRRPIPPSSSLCHPLRLLNVIKKIFKHIVIKEGGIYMPMDPTTGKTKGYVI
ncbi:hypothetical protein BDK51DRAFT_38712 [Blyttiomyces helicus]|uniref:Uncharacterized protein n=1 Tax=Blyttiomyces helicus TaxID=388810 RepID=A0A4P9WCM6_9FUNG|nr:hypothetical protein BDK51DRAFT_38712 [Blyttiomyces helicus]|eukprot:RKO88116.1 hypothetical protein BDK51DRAFT_38712 [Blyttiomyces helicus]